MHAASSWPCNSLLLVLILKYSFLMKTATYLIEKTILLALYGKQTTNARIQIIQYTLDYLFCEYVVNCLSRLNVTGLITKARIC